VGSRQGEKNDFGFGGGVFGFGNLKKKKRRKSVVVWGIDCNVEGGSWEVGNREFGDCERKGNRTWVVWCGKKEVEKESENGKKELDVEEIGSSKSVVFCWSDGLVGWCGYVCVYVCLFFKQRRGCGQCLWEWPIF